MINNIHTPHGIQNLNLSINSMKLQNDKTREKGFVFSNNDSRYNGAKTISSTYSMNTNTAEFIPRYGKKYNQNNNMYMNNSYYNNNTHHTSHNEYNINPYINETNYNNNITNNIYNINNINNYNQRETVNGYSSYDAFSMGYNVQSDELEKKMYNGNLMLQGINFDEYENVKVETTNYESFQPITHFAQARFSPIIQKNISLCKYTKPTPIQKYCIPAILSQVDVMASAQTGSGKTAAFLLPILECLLSDTLVPIIPHTKNTCYPRALIICPTRELAQQIHKDAKRFLYCTNLNCACIYGGSNKNSQLKNLSQYGVDLLIATTGRLCHFHQDDAISLSNVNYFVMDEADRMLDMGFGKEINFILHHSDIKKQRVNLLFSATLPPNVQQLAMKFLNPNYVFLAVGKVGGTCKLVDQQFALVEKDKKNEYAANFLKSINGASCLMFVNTKKQCNTVTWYLRNKNIRVDAIHGDKSQFDREKSLKKFGSGKIQCLVATDVVARGIDIHDIKYVLQYDLSNQIDSYIHRIGRTGRCGHKGTALTFINESDGTVIPKLIELLNGEKKENIPSWLYELQSKVGGKNHRKGRRNNYRSNYRSNNYVNRNNNQNRNYQNNYSNNFRNNHVNKYENNPSMNNYGNNNHNNFNSNNIQRCIPEWNIYN